VERAPLATAVASRTCCLLGPNAAPVWSGSGPSVGAGAMISARFQRLFDEEIATAMSDRHVALVAPSEEQAEMLRRGERLLLQLLPTVSRNVLRFVHLVAVADVRERDDGAETHKYLSASASSNRVPGTVFLTPRALCTPLDAAEALLHEACHKLLHDLILTRPILRLGYSPKQSPTITAIWNPSFPWNPNRWPIDRALLAAHVYVHLALFFKTVCETGAGMASPRDLPGTSAPEVWRRVTYDRARYLLRHLVASAGEELGQFGFELVDWLRVSLVSIDASPPEKETLAA
jgi:HEXXH motif-containing protein